MNKQITEDYVPYEVAKLLKEKGFDIPVYQYYFSPSNDNLNYLEFANDWNSVWEHAYSAPTHQTALKWQKEVHNIWIYADWCGDRGFQPNIVNIKHDEKVYFLDGTGLLNGYNNPSEVIEMALFYVLKNLI